MVHMQSERMWYLSDINFKFHFQKFPLNYKQSFHRGLNFIRPVKDIEATRIKVTIFTNNDPMA